MANGLRIIPDALRSIDSSTISGTYQVIGTPLSFATPLIKFVNNSTMDITISWDGVTDHDFIPAGGFALYDFGSDSGTIRGLFASQGTRFWVKGTAGTGAIYIAAFYTSEY